MREAIWRVQWNVKGTHGPHKTLEFCNESGAVGWAEALVNAGANGVTVTEFIVGRTLHFNSSKPLAEK